MISKERMKQLEEQANIVLKNHDIINDIGFDIVKLANNEGFIVALANLDNNMDGFILIDEEHEELLGQKTKKIIVVNQKRTKEEIRFVIAHELAHYYLEGVGLKLYASREHKHGRSQSENEMDYFAACLLMNKNIFLQAAQNIFNPNGNILNSVEVAENEFNSKCIQLASMFRVPVDSASRRVIEVVNSFTSDKKTGISNITFTEV